MTLTAEKRNVFLLAGAQALFQTAMVMMVTVAGLAGQMLATDKSLATLPVAITVLATAVLMIPAAMFMQRYGRQAGFFLGIACGALAGVLGAWSLSRGDFALFVAANALLGAYQSFAQYYRFAAADAASTDFKSRAIAWVIAGGVFAAIVGPGLAHYTRETGAVPFMVSYLVLGSLSIVASAMVFALRLPVVAAASTAPADAARSLAQIMRQPVFIAALTTSTIGFAIMVMVMTATPLAMKFCGQSAGAATTVIQGHVLGMFVPSFFTGNLIRRFGVVPIIVTGIVLLLLSVLIAFSGNEFAHFLSGLVFLGLGWNFLFIGGSTLLVDAYRPSEKAKTQAAHDFTMFIGVSAASLSAGSLLNIWGWEMVNLVSVPFLLAALGVVGWYSRIQK